MRVPIKLTFFVIGDGNSTPVYYDSNIKLVPWLNTATYYNLKPTRR